MPVTMFVLLAVILSVASANPLLQALLTQTCPICEQNSLKNQLQNLLFQSANNYQPYPQVYMNQNPAAQILPAVSNKQSSSICQPQNSNQNFQVPSYQNQVVSQPYCPCAQQSVKTQNNLAAVPGTVNQILSNPALQAILDPNTKLYNQNGLEVPRNGNCNAGTPQVINNYIIIPPEVLNEDNKGNSGRKVKDKSNDKRAKSRNQNEKRKPKSGNTQRDSHQRKSVKPEVNENNKVNVRNLNEGQRKQKRGQKNKNSDIKVKVVTENPPQEVKEVELIKKENNIPAPQKEIRTTSTYSTECKNNTEPDMPTSIQNKEDITTGNDVKTKKNEDFVKVGYASEDAKPKQKEQNSSSIKQDTEVIKIQVPITKETSRENPKRKINHPSNNSSKQVTKVTPSRNTNPREEAVIIDFKRKFPNIPEDVVRNLLDYMKRQLMNQNLGTPGFYYPQFPINYDYLYRNQFAPVPNVSVSTNKKKTSSNAQKTPNNIQNRKRRRKNRRSKIQQRKPEKTTTPATCDTTVELNPTVEITTTIKNEVETTTISTTTITETTPLVEEVTEPVKVVVASEIVHEIHPDETTTPTVAEKLESDKNADINHANEVKTAELGAEDIVPTIYVNELDDEYYPDFTGDHQYYSDEDFSLLRFEDDRYYYTADKNFPLEELNRERRRFDASTLTNLRRPPSRYIFRLKNKDKSRSKTRLNSEKRKPKVNVLSTTSRPTLDTNTANPKIRVKIEAEDFAVPREVTKKLESIEQNIEKPKTYQDTEEIQFRTPPTLEKIDFETKQINKKNNYNDDLDFKTSTYSDVKTPQYNFNKNSDKSTNLNNKQRVIDQIETVYAKSKVVTYGKPVMEEISEQKDVLEESEEKLHGLFSDEDKTIVIAKSITGDYW